MDTKMKNHLFLNNSILVVIHLKIYFVTYYFACSAEVLVHFINLCVSYKVNIFSFRSHFLNLTLTHILSNYLACLCFVCINYIMFESSVLSALQNFFKFVLSCLLLCGLHFISRLWVRNTNLLICEIHLCTCLQSMKLFEATISVLLINHHTFDFFQV